jgi:putative oxidoreductase
MSTLQQIHRWSLTHHPRWLIVLRVALGICLFVKGISFVVNTTSLQSAIQNSIFPTNSAFLIILITWAHLLGGFLIIAGLLTRWAVLLQIPILVGAVFFVNAQKGMFTSGSEFAFSLLLLLMLAFFLTEGGGPLSLDEYFRKNPV